MAEILKVTTPLIDRPQSTQAPKPMEGVVPFDLSDVTKVIGTNEANELMQQNTGLPPEEAPKILTDLLKDPSVTAGIIRNINLLQEVFKLLPAHNTTLTKELEELFNALMLGPDQIVPELQYQEQHTTMFKGDFFDLLRNLLDASPAPTAENLAQALSQALERSADQPLPLPQQDAPQTGTAGPGAARPDAPQPGVPGQNAAPGEETQPPQGAIQNPAQKPLEGHSPNAYALSSQSVSVDPSTLTPQTTTGIGVLLKALNAAMTKGDTLESVSNNLAFLADALSASPRLSDKLENLVRALRTPDAEKNFPVLKDEIINTLREVENSVLFTPQMEKIVPLVVYNLSRYNDNPDFLPDALRLLLSTVNDPALKQELIQKLGTYLDKNAVFGGGLSAQQAGEQDHVMDIIAKIIGKQISTDEIHLLSSDNIEKIVQSLLSSPSNFTPLLHYVIPVDYMGLKAFAEMWIDPNVDTDKTENNKKGSTAGSSHVLAVFDVEGIGRFETELFVENRRIAMNLLVPPAYLEAFQNVGSSIRKAVSAIGYSFEAINIDRLERTHSLMEVFTDLPHKRMGVDVRI